MTQTQMAEMAKQATDNLYYQKKFDQGKDRWELVDLNLIWPIVAILTYGAKKYSPNSWQKVPNARKRYWAAMMRHLTAHQAGEKYDPESKHPHLWHAMCNMYFLMYFDLKSFKQSVYDSNRKGGDRNGKL